MIEIVRAALRREVLEYDGRVFQLPLPEGQGTGLGKPLKMLTKPERPAVPLYIAALGELSVKGLPNMPTAGCPSCSARSGPTPCGEMPWPRALPNVPPIWLPCRSRPAAWSRSVRTSRDSWTSCARCSLSTSAAWAPGARTSTTNSPVVMASRRRPRRSGSLSGRQEEGG